MFALWKRVVLGGILAATIPAVGQDASTSGTMSHQMAGAGHDSEMHQAMEKMNRDMMGGPMSGDPDKDFATMMIPHHQGAIDMAQIYLKTAKDEKLRKLAQKIIEDQQKEIKEMREHLDNRRTSIHP